MLNIIAESYVWFYYPAEINEIVPMIILDFVKLNTSLFYLFIKLIKGLAPFINC